MVLGCHLFHIGGNLSRLHSISKTIVIALLLTIFSLLPAGWALADGAAAPVLIEPGASGVVELQQKPGGGYSWRVTSDVDADQYVASWTRAEGTWSSVDEALAAVREGDECRNSVAQTMLNGFASYADFQAQDENPDPEVWVTAAFQKKFAACAAKSGVDYQRVVSQPTESGLEIEVPFDLLGPGTHELFIVALQYPEKARGNPLCAQASFPDGWAFGGCRSTPSAARMFSVTVPYPAAEGTVLPAVAIEKGAAFDSTVFSYLPKAPVAGITEGQPETLSKVGLTTIVALVLAILIALPTELLESTISKNHTRVAVFTRKLLPAQGRGHRGRAMAQGGEVGVRPSNRLRLFGRLSRWWSLPVLIAGSVIAGFAEPNFGINWMSLRLVATIFVSFLIVNLGGTFLTWLITRKHTGSEKPRLTARPFYLLLILLTVLFARTVAIEPALVFGTLLAIDFGVRLSRIRSAWATVAGAAYATVLGLAAWVGYTTIAQFKLTDVGNLSGIDNQYTFQVYTAISFAQTGLGELASVICVQALSTVPIALLPLAFLSGSALWQWKKWVWVVTYAFGLAAYSLVLVPMPTSWKQISQSLALWIGVFLTYAIFAVGLWVYFRVTANSAARQNAANLGPVKPADAEVEAEAEANKSEPSQVPSP